MEPYLGRRIVASTATGEDGSPVYNENDEVFTIGEIVYFLFDDLINIAVITDFAYITSEIEVMQLTPQKYRGRPHPANRSRWFKVAEIFKLSDEYVFKTFPEEWLKEFLCDKFIENLDDLEGLK